MSCAACAASAAGSSPSTPQPPTGRPLARRKRSIQPGSGGEAASFSPRNTANQQNPDARICCQSQVGSKSPECQTMPPACCHDIGTVGGAAGGGAVVVAGGGAVVVVGGGAVVVAGIVTVTVRTTVGLPRSVSARAAARAPSARPPASRSQEPGIRRRIGGQCA